MLQVNHTRTLSKSDTHFKKITRKLNIIINCTCVFVNHTQVLESCSHALSKSQTQFSTLPVIKERYRLPKSSIRIVPLTINMIVLLKDNFAEVRTAQCIGVISAWKTFHHKFTTTTSKQLLNNAICSLLSLETKARKIRLITTTMICCWHSFKSTLPTPTCGAQHSIQSTVCCSGHILSYAYNW